MNKKNYFICLILTTVFVTAIVIYLIQLINYILILKYRFDKFNHQRFNTNRINKNSKSISFINKIFLIKPFNNIKKEIINILDNFEYISFVIDIVLGFILILLPLFNYFNFGKKIEKLLEILGRVIGFIALILTIFNLSFNIKDIKDNFIKEYEKSINITSALTQFNNNNSKLNNKSDNDLVSLKKKEKKNVRKEIFFYDNLEKYQSTFFWNRNSIIHENNMDLNKNNFHFNYLLFSRIILIILNLSLAYIGYYTYKNDYSSKTKAIYRFKKCKK